MVEIYCFKYGIEFIFVINVFCEEFIWFYCNNFKFIERMND